VLKTFDPDLPVLLAMQERGRDVGDELSEALLRTRGDEGPFLVVLDNVLEPAPNTPPAALDDLFPGRQWVTVLATSRRTIDFDVAVVALKPLVLRDDLTLVDELDVPGGHPRLKVSSDGSTWTIHPYRPSRSSTASSVSHGPTRPHSGPQTHRPPARPPSPLHHHRWARRELWAHAPLIHHPDLAIPAPKHPMTKQESQPSGWLS